ncbi:hypothetical protein NE237_008198 [Protea cynaroides]|uniref:Uncharacterized protein n=1 Tax=Protea cynaroides TaxID=273540 RepID=A0A9Q0KRL7_9MAGN|nr:hypothetical protein NE237_008198 [Protea cynaroides]
MNFLLIFPFAFKRQWILELSSEKSCSSSTCGSIAASNARRAAPAAASADPATVYLPGCNYCTDKSLKAVEGPEQMRSSDSNPEHPTLLMNWERRSSKVYGISTPRVILSRSAFV